MSEFFYSLTNPQKNIWNMEKFFEGTTINNICTSAIIYEKINKTLLEKAINHVVQKNDSFRIKINIKEGIPVQKICNFEPFNLEFEYIKDESELANIKRELVNYKFNILNSYLFQFKIAIFENGFFAIVLVVNHIIADSWSLGLVIKSILEEYHALQNNIALPENTNSYIDFVHSEEKYVKSKKFETDKKYWNDIFNSIPEQATIPTHKEKVKSSSSKANRENFLLENHLVQKINHFCSINKISVFNFLMAIYAIYIGRVSNLECLVLGTPILNRANFKEKQTMGMFVNTIPVKIELPENISFSEFTHYLNSNFMSVLKHQKYSYPQILEDIRDKNENIQNLYNILISYQITKAFDENYGNYQTEWYFNNYCGNDFNIHITDLNDTGNLLISYDYLTDKYDLKDVSDLHARIIYMIEQILNDENIKNQDIEIVTEKEKNKILYGFNVTDANYPKDKTIVDLFEEQVLQTPNNIAVVFENQKLTSQELNQKANSLATYLIHSCINPKDIIASRIDKSLEMIIGILAIIKAGCCYLPINMQYPQERIEFMLHDTQTKLLLGSRESLNTFNLDIQKLDISLSQEEIYANSNENLGLEMSPEDLIYIIYTSGTTGTPKGAMLCHKNVVRLLKNDKLFFDFNEKDSWTMFHSIAFDFSVWEMYGALLYGGKLVIVPDYTAKDPNLFLDLMEKENITILNQTPTYFYNLLSCEVKNPHQNLKIRYIIFGGEALKPNVILPWHELHPETKLINMYGITETTVHVTFKELSEKDLNLPTSNIGVPIPTLKILLLDKNLKLVPYGVPGEICVCGGGVFKGYLNRPDLNETKLIPNPYNPQEIMYRSADSAILNYDNTLEYLGRIDKQVKIRGFRVELSEIEEKISQFPNITSCIVTTRTGTNMHDLLCAYYIAANAKIDIKELRNTLQKKLPSYMIPQYFIEVKEWPYNHNGKIDRTKLPEPQYQNIKKEIILARNEIDEKLIHILNKLMKINHISIDDSFFDLGGDSLSAINLCIHIQSEFHVELFVKDILEHPTIQEISDIIANNINTSESQIIKQIPKADFYPTSSAQKRIYYASQVAGSSSTAYNMPGGMIFEGYLDTKKLENCFKTLIARHEALRTRFKVHEDTIVQEVLDNVDFHFPILQNISFEKLDNIFHDFVMPFDLSIAPLFRAEFIQFTNKKSALLLDMHHIISDGTSMAIFTNEICKLYNNETLPHLDITYKDVAVFENERTKSEKFKKAQNYWIHQFDGEIPILNFPTSYPRPGVQSFEGDKIYASIDENTTQKIKDISNHLGITPYMLLLSCYYILLSKYTSQEDIIVGSPVVGRDIASTYDLIGMFVNTLALRNHIDASSSFKDFALTVKENVLNAYQYQTFPFDELVNQLNIKRDTSRNPLFDTMFIYQNNGYAQLNIHDLKAEYYTPNTHISKFDLSLEIIPNNHGLLLNFEYATKLFNEEFIQNLSKHYLNIINIILNNIDTKIIDISILSEKEINKVLYEFNNTEANYSKDKTIVDLFEEQVLKTPNNIAVVFEEQTLTYQELNEKANCLAYYLRNHQGIRPNDLVGIMVNRSLEMMIAIFAVLKAGGAYIPIDPTYPKDRIDYMLNSSQAKVLLTQKKLQNKIDFYNKISIDYNNETIYSLPNTNLEKVNQPEDLIYVIFTSGSTGKPKGVMLMHKNINNFIHSVTKQLNLTHTQTIVSITTVSFDIFVLESLLPLLNGLKVVIANEEAQTNIKLFNELCLNNNVQIVQTTPSRMQSFVTSDNQYLEFLKKITHILIGGEPFTKPLFNKLKRICRAKIYNMYGPTETAVWSSMKELTNSNIITIGKPIDNTQIYILDKKLNAVPVGISGDLYISGDGVSKGYLNNQDLTEKSFIPNPFIPGTIMYKTGDLGKYEQDGNIICLGRSDNQIKIRGLRIELEEIENLILKYPHIDKVTVVKQTVQEKEFISAYYVANKRIIINELRKYLSFSLPRYMVPSYFIPLDDLPYTPNGKIDKKSLPLSKEILSIGQEKYEAPKTELQKQLVSIWENILNTKPIGINDNFFELGRRFYFSNELKY